MNLGGCKGQPITENNEGYHSSQEALGVKVTPLGVCREEQGAQEHRA